MEIERKFLIKALPPNLETYPHDTLMQAYLSTDPVIRVRQKNEDYILTVKSSGLLARQETELPLTGHSFKHLLEKKDGIAIEKMRYKIPEKDGYTIELDVFSGVYEGFCMAEVEFPSIEAAESYEPPTWFAAEVTMDARFHNSSMSTRSPESVTDFLALFRQMQEGWV